MRTRVAHALRFAQTSRTRRTELFNTRSSPLINPEILSKQPGPPLTKTLLRCFVVVIVVVILTYGLRYLSRPHAICRFDPCSDHYPACISG